MGKFFSAVGDTLKDTLIDQPLDITKNVLKGDLGGAFDSFKGTFGENNRGLSNILDSVGIGGWVGKHPQEAAGALVGTIVGGMYGAAAMGLGGAASAGGAGAATGAGSAMAYAPTASTVLGGVGSGTGTAAGLGTMGTGATSGLLGTGIGTTGFGTGAGMSYAPLSSSVLTPTAGEAAFSLGAGGLNGVQGVQSGGSQIQDLIQQAQRMNQNKGQQEQQQQPVMQQPVQPQRKGGGMAPIITDSNAGVKAAQNVRDLLQRHSIIGRK